MNVQRRSERPVTVARGTVHNNKSNNNELEQSPEQQHPSNNNQYNLNPKFNTSDLPLVQSESPKDQYQNQALDHDEFQFHTAFTAAQSPASSAFQSVNNSIANTPINSAPVSRVNSPRGSFSFPAGQGQGQGYNQSELLEYNRRMSTGTIESGMNSAYTTINNNQSQQPRTNRSASTIATVNTHRYYTPNQENRRIESGSSSSAAAAAHPPLPPPSSYWATRINSNSINRSAGNDEQLLNNHTNTTNNINNQYPSTVRSDFPSNLDPSLDPREPLGIPINSEFAAAAAAAEAEDEAWRQLVLTHGNRTDSPGTHPDFSDFNSRLPQASMDVQIPIKEL